MFSQFDVMSGIITKFYPVVKSSKTGAGACVHSEIKCDIKQKSYSEVNCEMRLNPQITHTGILREPQSQSKM